MRAVSGKDSDDGQYFEVDEKGQLRLKQGKKKIDLSKLTDDDLRRLGIDPSLSKQEIARLLKVGGDGGGTGPCETGRPQPAGEVGRQTVCSLDMHSDRQETLCTTSSPPHPEHAYNNSSIQFSSTTL